MSPEENQCETCAARAENEGVCALHKVEMLRAKTTADLVIKLERTTNALTKFMWTMMGVSLLGSMVLIGSYVYTSTIERNLSGRQDVAQEIVETLSKEVVKARVDLAVTEDRYLRIYQRLETINDRLEKMVEQNQP